MKRKPDFEQILKVLAREVPDRPTPFEFHLNGPLVAQASGQSLAEITQDTTSYLRAQVRAYQALGYDYALLQASPFCFPSGQKHLAKSISLNDGGTISDEESFQKYVWPDPEQFGTQWLDAMQAELQPGVKFIVPGPYGVLETVIDLVGYEPLCIMSIEEPELYAALFENVGRRLLRYFEMVVNHPAVGAILSNDDWGFAQQTMLPPDDLRNHVFPWHQRFVAAAHAAGKPALLHSCGYMNEVIDDIIDVIKFDGKHSYEDKIHPVEWAYENWGDRIAIMGGIDVDFLVRHTPEQIRERAEEMLALSAQRGGYALGSGNSIPEYVPTENYLAMQQTAVGELEIMR